MHTFLKWGTIPSPRAAVGRVARRQKARAGGGGVQLPVTAPRPPPLLPTRKRSRGEGSGEARRVAFEMCACRSPCGEREQAAIAALSCLTCRMLLRRRLGGLFEHRLRRRIELGQNVIDAFGIER